MKAEVVVLGMGPGGEDVATELAKAGMDVDEAVYTTFDELVVYCRRVGGTIGRLVQVSVEGDERPEVPLGDPSAISTSSSTIGARALASALRGLIADATRRADLGERARRRADVPDA